MGQVTITRIIPVSSPPLYRGGGKFRESIKSGKSRFGVFREFSGNSALGSEGKL